MCRTRIVAILSPSLADGREACLRDMQETTRYFIGPGKYWESKFTSCFEKRFPGPVKFAFLETTANCNNSFNRAKEAFPRLSAVNFEDHIILN